MNEISAEIKGHFLRLYAMAFTDSNFHPTELDMLYSFAEERGVSKALGVSAKAPIKECTQFGPLQGEQVLLKDITDDFEMKELWQVLFQHFSNYK